jgi:hypothetical protein
LALFLHDSESKVYQQCILHLWCKLPLTGRGFQQDIAGLTALGILREHRHNSAPNVPRPFSVIENGFEQYGMRCLVRRGTLIDSSY